MKASEWAKRFFERLSELRGGPVDYASEVAGFVRARLGRLGLLIICEDDGSDFEIWLLDSDGRTDGPVWAGQRNEATASDAAVKANDLINATPADVKFSMRTPTHRDFELEDLLNSAWQDVLAELDRIQVGPKDEATVENAIQAVCRFIDRLPESRGEAGLAEYSGPFKHKAAELIRAKLER
jgi:hypothetical protein